MENHDVEQALRSLRGELQAELTDDILPFWMTVGRDRDGGFYGAIDNDNVADRFAERSAVMIARHLWTYSAAARVVARDPYLPVATAAARYLRERVWDLRYGGVYWSVTADGRPLDRKKQVYAQAFAIYALAEQSRATLDPEPFRMAFELFVLLELHARDPRFGGYVEARAHDWSEVPASRLSSVDLVCEKSMNTNLHVLEALTNLLRAAMLFAPGGRISGNPECARIASALSDQIRTMENRVLQPDGHLGLFFTLDWSRLEQKISFGHDIEASWLIVEAREVAGEYYRDVNGPAAVPNGHTKEQFALSAAETVPALSLAEATLREGFDVEHGGIYDECEDGEIDPCRIWWCQAEAIVGFVSAYQMTGREEYAGAALSTWSFVRRHLLDRAGGEWFWGVTGTGSLLPGYPKGGNWKTGYHAGRACMEIMRRVDAAPAY